MPARNEDFRRTARGLSLLIAAALATLAACATLQERKLESRFDSANRIVSDPESSPEQLAQAREDFAAVAAELTEAWISELPAEERADAFTTRGYSEWRTDRLSEAAFSVRRARVDPLLVAGSRADVLSGALEGLVLASREVFRWNVAARTISPFQYGVYERNFQQALDSVEAADARVSSLTPEPTLAFVKYARWRIAAEWRWVFATIQGSDPVKKRKVMLKARRRILKRLGAAEPISPREAVEALIQHIPDTSPLRRLAEAQPTGPPPRPGTAAAKDASGS